ncbi:hypothetical protein TrVE_jg2597 [Triparma verrucosa]|uniref:Uncharacterized protein n=1 Tax=Triparma verrucosa TaxID=1606542 RepID=A0A9W7ETN0_9STRA|nr:hypothetical protein TrVE_jg2597 [Triparma verrucosa]
MIYTTESTYKIDKISSHPNPLSEDHDPPAHETHAPDEDAYWVQPPKSKDGKLIMVNCRINLNNLSKVNTAEGVCSIEIFFVCYWTDQRLIGYNMDAELPPKLWGPRMEIMGLEMDESHGEFGLVDPGTGRCKRGRLYKGVIGMEMNLSSFPFDQNSIDVRFFTSSTWMSYDEGSSGMPATTATYTIRSVEEGAREGNWCTLDWSTKVHEFRLHGLSTNIEEQSTDSNGAQMNYVNISFHLSREAGYYFWKVLLPLWTLTILNFTAFEFDTADLSDRMGFISTCFLAGYAMLYVVGDSIPKMSFLTSIDLLISFNNFVIFLSGLSCRIIYIIQKKYGSDLGKAWNFWIEVTLAISYVVVNIVLLLPSFLKQRGEERVLMNSFYVGHRSDHKIPTVPDHYHYIQYKNIPTYEDPPGLLRKFYVPSLTERAS